MSDSANRNSSLESYLWDTLFEEAKKNREPMEAKWQRNHDAFHSITSTGYWKKKEGEGWRSNAFVGITKVKVLSAFSLVSDMELQGGKIPFLLKPSAQSGVVLDELGEQEREDVDTKIEDMSKTMEQQLEDCKGDRQLLLCIMSDGLYGEAVAKRFVHDVENITYQPRSFAPDGSMDDPRFVRFEEVRESVTQPAFQYMSLWNFYRDVETDDLQAGWGGFHRDLVSPFDLRKEIGEPFYLDDRIEEVIEEDDSKDDQTGSAVTDKERLPPGHRDFLHRRKNMERREFWGRAPLKYVLEFEAELKDGRDATDATGRDTDDTVNDGNEVEIMMMLVNGKAIRFARTEPGHRPFYRTVWEINLDEPSGTGVADNVEGSQMRLNGAVRAFHDNKALSANIIVAKKSSGMEDTSDEWYPGKAFEIADDVDDVRKVLQQIVITDVGDSLLSVIRLDEKYADIESMIPQIQQGVRPDKAAETAFELSQLLENAGKYMAGVIRNIDEGLIEPILADFYRYNMLDPSMNRGKGAYTIQALGFTSYQARVIRQQKLLQFLQVVFSNDELAAEAKGRGFLDELAKAFNIEIDQVLKSDEEKDKEAQGAEAARAEAIAMEDEERLKDAATEAEMQDLEHRLKMAEDAQELQGKLVLQAQEHQFDLEKQEQEIEGDFVMALIREGARRNESSRQISS